MFELGENCEDIHVIFVSSARFPASPHHVDRAAKNGKLARDGLTVLDGNPKKEGDHE